MVSRPLGGTMVDLERVRGGDWRHYSRPSPFWRHYLRPPSTILSCLPSPTSAERSRDAPPELLRAPDKRESGDAKLFSGEDVEASRTMWEDACLVAVCGLRPLDLHSDVAGALLAEDDRTDARFSVRSSKICEQRSVGSSIFPTTC